MRYILAICLLFSSYLLSSSLDNIEYKNSGYLEGRYTTGDKMSSGLVEAALYNDIYFGDNHRLTFSPVIRGYTLHNKDVSNINTSLNILYLDEFFYSYNITNNLSISIGQFSARDGWMSLVGGKNNSTGIGIYGVSDASMQGGIITYKKNNFTINAYAAAFNKYVRLDYIKDTDGDYKDYIRNTEGTYTFGMSTRLKLDERNKLYSQLNYVKQMYKDDHITESYSATVGYTWDDRHYSGLSMYSSVGVSYNIKNTNNSIANILYKKNRAYGFFFMAGINYQISEMVFNRDGEMGIEYSYSSKYYPKNMSLKYIYPGKYSESGHQVISYVGININSDTSIKLKYIHHHSGNQNPEEKIRERAKAMHKYHAIQLHLLYSF